jgi:hypothetical protein
MLIKRLAPGWGESTMCHEWVRHLHDAALEFGLYTACLLFLISLLHVNRATVQE